MVSVFDCVNFIAAIIMGISSLIIAYCQLKMDKQNSKEQKEKGLKNAKKRKTVSELSKIMHENFNSFTRDMQKHMNLVAQSWIGMSKKEKNLLDYYQALLDVFLFFDKTKNYTYGIIDFIAQKSEYLPSVCLEIFHSLCETYNILSKDILLISEDINKIKSVLDSNGDNVSEDTLINLLNSSLEHNNNIAAHFSNVIINIELLKHAIDESVVSEESTDNIA